MHGSVSDQAVEAAALAMARLIASVEAQRGEPDICRFHREAANDALAAAYPFIRADVAAEIVAWLRAQDGNGVKWAWPAAADALDAEFGGTDHG